MRTRSAGAGSGGIRGTWLAIDDLKPTVSSFHEAPVSNLSPGRPPVLSGHMRRVILAAVLRLTAADLAGATLLWSSPTSLVRTGVYYLSGG